jgi:hypothetical protein
LDRGILVGAALRQNADPAWQLTAWAVLFVLTCLMRSWDDLGCAGPIEPPPGRNHFIPPFPLSFPSSPRRDHHTRGPTKQLGH